MRVLTAGVLVAMLLLNGCGDKAKVVTVTKWYRVGEGISTKDGGTRGTSGWWTKIKNKGSEKAYRVLITVEAKDLIAGFDRTAPLKISTVRRASATITPYNYRLRYELWLPGEDNPKMIFLTSGIDMRPGEEVGVYVEAKSKPKTKKIRWE